jgi:hypothetical protein
MALNQVRQASKVLGPLLRKRGTSPAVGAALRRALQALDKAFSGLAAQAQDETVAAGMAELRSCVDLIRQSDRPADHEQLEGVEKALALLAPAEEAVPAVPMPDLVLAAAKDPPASARKPEAQAAKVGPARRAARAFDLGAAGALLGGYEAKLHMLHVVASGPLFRNADLDAATAELDKQVHALRWLGKDRIPEILCVADTAKSLADRLAAGAALVHLGDAHGAEMVVGLLGKAAADKQPLPEDSQTLLRTFTDDSVVQWFLKVFLLPVHPTVCGLLLPLLAERNLLSSDQLWNLLGHARDEVAVEAAQALVWSDGQVDTQALLAWARQARTSRRANALLYAATVFGSSAALAEVRARAQAGEAVDRLLALALAVAGDASDAVLLMRLAEQFEDDAPVLLLAAANLGCAGTLAALPALEGRVPADVLEEARRRIAGAPGQAGNVGTAKDVRLLRGQPWSVEGLLACLQAPGEPLQAQRHLALELRVRTGQASPRPLPLLVPGAARPGLLADWNSCYAKANGRLKPGVWYYQGKPVNPSTREMSA